MKDYGFAALLLVVAYITMFVSGVFRGSGIDPLIDPYGRLVAFIFFLLLVFATGVLFVAKERKWYTALSVFLLGIIWFGIILSIIISQIDILGDFRF